jgi:hypothetical protein
VVLGAVCFCRYGGVNQLCADVAIPAPDHSVTPWSCVLGQAQREFVGDGIADCFDPYAAVGQFSNNAVPRLSSVVGKQNGQMLDTMAFCMASFRAHSPWFSNCGTSSGTYTSFAISLGLNRSLEFVGHFIQIRSALPIL